jgi:hypothetical protein
MTGAAPFKYFKVQSSLALANASVNEIPFLFVVIYFLPLMLAFSCFFRSPRLGPVKRLDPTPMGCSGSGMSEPARETGRWGSQRPQREKTPEESLSMSRSVTSQRLASIAGLLSDVGLRRVNTFRLIGMQGVFPMVQSLRHLLISHCYSRIAS